MLIFVGIFFIKNKSKSTAAPLLNDLFSIFLGVNLVLLYFQKNTIIIFFGNLL